MIRFRQSSFQTYAECRRKFFFIYVLGWEPKRADHKWDSLSRIGTAVHADAEEHLLPAGSTRVVAKPDLELGEKKYVANMSRNLRAWFEETGFNTGMRIVSSEEELVHDITPGVELKGTIDMVREDTFKHDEPLNIVDFKTKAGFEPPHASDFQLRTYAWLAREDHGRTPEVVSHVQVKRIKDNARAKKPYVDYFPLTMSDTVLDNHEGHLAVMADEMEALSLLDITDPKVYPMSKPSCEWSCRFSAVCPLVDNGGDWERALEVDFKKAGE